MKEGTKLPKQEKIRMLGKNKIYKYFGILEVDIIKQRQMKKELKKSILGERRNYRKINYITEIPPKRLTPGLSPL